MTRRLGGSNCVNDSLFMRSASCWHHRGVHVLHGTCCHREAHDLHETCVLHETCDHRDHDLHVTCGPSNYRGHPFLTDGDCGSHHDCHDHQSGHPCGLDPSCGLNGHW